MLKHVLLWWCITAWTYGELHRANPVYPVANATPAAAGEREQDSLAGWEAQAERLYGIGYAHSTKGDDSAAVMYYEQAVRLYERHSVKPTAQLALLYNNMAYSYSSTYLKFNTIAYYQQAIAMWEALKLDEKETNDLITAYQNLIFELVAYGDLAQARKECDGLNRTFYERYLADRQYVKSTAHFKSSRQMQLLGNVRIEAAEGNFDGAYGYIDTLKSEWLPSWSESDGSSVGIILGAYQTLFDHTHIKAKHELTKRYAREALQLAERYDVPFYRLVSNAKLATACEQLGEYEDALAYILKAETSMTFASFSPSHYAIQTIKAMIYAGLDRHDEAIAIMEHALTEAIEHRTGRLTKLEEVPAEVLGDFSSYTFIRVFSVGAKLYLDHYRKTAKPQSLTIAGNLYRLSAAIFSNYYLAGEYNEQLDQLHLDITEGLLAVVLMAEDGDRLADQIASINLIERNASQHLIKEYERKSYYANPERMRLTADRQRLETRYRYYEEMRDQGGWQGHDVEADSVMAAIQDIEEVLQPKRGQRDELDSYRFDLGKMMSSIPKDEQVAKFYVTSHHVYRLLITDSRLLLEKMGSMDALRDMVIGYVNRLSALDADHEGLSDSLFHMLLQGLDVRSVCIVPDNFLNYLPFESLKPMRAAQYWGQEVSVSYAYSLPMWLLHRTVRQGGKAQLRLAAFAPQYDGVDLTHDRQQLHDLRFAQHEAATVATMLRGDVYLHQQASKEMFIQQLDNYGIFHFAMHSFLYEDDFMQSCLVFSGAEKLYFSELYDLHIPAEMVVLSACNTGNGKLVSGEGIMSLSRAFAYAGVPSTVVSLWQVPDRETSEIMLLFYQYLKDGQTKRDALANAKRKFITNNPMKSHPYYWAGFVVNGDISPIPHRSNGWWVVAVGVLLFGGISIMAYHRIRNHKLFNSSQ